TPEPTATASPTPITVPTNAVSITSAAVTADATTIPVTDVSKFPGSGTIEFLDNGEQATYNGTTTTPAGSGFRPAIQLGTWNNAVRGANGTTKTDHPAGTGIAIVPPPATTTLEDEGGCQIGTASHGSSWLLLIPMVGLLALRRRSR